MSGAASGEAFGGPALNVAAWLVDRHVEEGRGDRVAIRCEGTSTTYAELLDLVSEAQHRLADLGVAQGDRVAMVVRDDLGFPAWFLGALRSGIVPIPLSTMLLGPALGAIVADSGAQTVVISSVFASTLADICAAAPEVTNVVVLGVDQAAVDVGRADVTVHGWPAGSNERAGSGDRDRLPVAETTADSPAFWLYSSGTTGVPKGVMHVHGSVPATVETYAQGVLEITENDRFLSVAKLFFAYGLGNSLTFPLAVAGTAILNPDPPAPASVAQLIADEEPTLFFSSPGFCAALLDAGLAPETFSSLRATVTAGESLPANIQTRFAELSGQPVLDGIGSTELLHIFISNTLTEQTPGASGQVVPGYVAELRNDEGEVVTEPDTPGYLHVQGPSAAVGYWQREEATAAAFVDGWVRTGDVYVRSAADRWTFLGRNNDMIKAGGIWVSPAEVESALIEHADVMEAAVVGARDDAGLETVVAFVLPTTGAQPTEELLVDHCRERMAAFKRPRQIIVVDELPKTATGKIKRFELRNSLT